MNSSGTEADARIVIDGRLRDAGWDPADNSQVKAEVSVKSGQVDYVFQ